MFSEQTSRGSERPARNQAKVSEGDSKVSG
jgi:hypothetical protein